MWLNCGPGGVPILRYVMLDKLVFLLSSYLEYRIELFKCFVTFL